MESFRKLQPFRQLRIENHLDGDHRLEMERDILQGLTRRPKSIPCKYFYDACGSQLFDRICSTAEYYPTATELAILETSAAEIMGFFSSRGGSLVELGSGSCRKVSRLLAAVEPERLAGLCYVPVDISAGALRREAVRIRQHFAALEVFGIAADFTRRLDMLPGGRKLIAFFGSTIGNFEDAEALALLRALRAVMDPEDRLVLGIDMLKSVDILEAAYNDAQGVTERFNLNVLSHINRELNADFNLADFEHLAFFRPDKERIEMHLRARRPVTVEVRDLDLGVRFHTGETIHTESCRKFSRENATRLFLQAGLAPIRWHTDGRGWFSLVQLRPFY